MPNFYWSYTKAARNLIEHDGVSFVEAKTVYEDYDAISTEDATNPEREIWIGKTKKHKLLIVVFHIFADENVVCICSAWKANRRQRRRYENCK